MENLTRPRRVLYANGHLGFSILDNIYGAYLLFFLIPPDELGMPQLVDNSPLLFGITVVGLINIFGRVVDSVADPLVAWWSDNARYRIGRRRFFLLTGAIPFALSAVLLFTPPDAGISTLNAVYTALMLGLFFFMYTYYLAPNLALIPELSRTVGERISITVAQAAFTIGGAGVVLLGFPLIWGGLQAGGMEAGERMASETHQPE
ncbi:MAG: MFS transporter, partial [bacterium]